MEITIIKNKWGKTKQETKPYPIFDKPSPDQLVFNIVDIPGLIFCTHSNTRAISWPINDFLELCKDCGMSRHCKGLKTGKWVIIDVLYERDKLSKYLKANRSKSVCLVDFNRYPFVLFEFYAGEF
jgi:hypothetical protein